MKIYKTRFFARWAKNENVKDNSLLATIHEMMQGKIEVNLGGNLYKQRIGLGNKGKRGGARLIVALVINTKAFFVYGFSKKEVENIDSYQLNTLKELAEELLNYTEEQLHKAIFNNEILEVKYHEKERTE